MFKLNFVKRENDLNRLIKGQKRDRDDLILLYISLWDTPCTAMMSKLIDTYAHVLEGRVVNIVDSFSLPHSFVIHQVTTAPTLVYVTSKSTRKYTYIPEIWDFLGLE